MLSGTQVRVRYVKNAIVPLYIDTRDPALNGITEQLIEVYRESAGRTRSEIAEDLENLMGEGQDQLVHQGLAKLLEDRCEYEVVAEYPPEEIRERMFTIAATHRQLQARTGVPFLRETVLKQVSEEIGLPPEQINRTLFADMKDEQRVLSFEDITTEQLLHRYNLALAQAVILRSTGMKIRVWGESPARMRQLFRQIKFRRLIASIQESKGKGYLMQIDGPLSLFSSTQKYGLQLALFLPSLLHCSAFELQAELKWGAQKKARTFTLSATDGLRSHYTDYGVYTPPEFEIFAQNFRSQIHDWLISDDPNPIPLDGGIWVPDFKIQNTFTGRELYLELFGYWRKPDLESHYQRLKKQMPGKFLLIVAESMRADEGEELASANEVYHYKKTPSVDAVAKLAHQLI